MSEQMWPEEDGTTAHPPAERLDRVIGLLIATRPLLLNPPGHEATFFSPTDSLPTHLGDQLPHLPVDSGLVRTSASYSIDALRTTCEGRRKALMVSDDNTAIVASFKS